MKLEKQVVNLELSKKLKELGVKQESLYTWNREGKEHYLELSGTSRPLGVERIPAYTVAELGEMLKKDIELEIPHYFEYGKVWIFETVNGRTIESDTEANARAKMLIYLLENKLIEL